LQEPRKIPFYLSISGNIGVGKSTVCTLVSKQFGWPAYYESVENNPYLGDYYQDMPRWAFHLQIYFLSKRFEVQKEIIKHGLSAVQDRTIYEDVEIFAPVLHSMGCMDERDYINYREVFNNMISFLNPPDQVLYLRADPDIAMKRISERARGVEDGIPRDFIVKLHEAYEEWVDKVSEICPVKVIDADKVNLRDDEDAQQELFAFLQECHNAKIARIEAGAER
jgi:deoxyadenosine/deoxycytidine kinase